MSMEKMVRAVAYLRKSGGYNLLVAPCVQGGYVVTGSFKDPGAYGFTVSFAAAADILEEAQAACISGLANLCKLTEDSKPAVQQKPATTGSYSKPANGYAPKSSGPVSGAVVSLKGLKDDAWGKGKDLVKAAGFRYDSDSKDWTGGDVSQLPDWLKKRVKGAYAAPAAAQQAAPHAQAEEEEGPSSPEQTIANDVDLGSMPF